jgi:tetratricopeptide (TPR) repeat protein
MESGWFVGQRENVGRVLGNYMVKSGSPENRTRYFLRVLRPLFWWALLVLLLFGIRTHQRLMEKTRIYFNLTMQGKEERYLQSLLDVGDTPFGATATFDGNPILTGQKISLGYHTFKITHPKTEPFSTSLFIWYGVHDLGTIDLKRAKGTLIVTANPPAPVLSIEGPEYSVTLTNSPGLNASVPTDQYAVTARYRHSESRQSVAVFANTSNPLKIAPRFGSLQLTCDQSGANYQLLRLNDELVEIGDLPASVFDLPEGTYKLVAWHHNHEWAERLFVNAGKTNTLPVEFQYGTAVLESTPSGAEIFTTDGRDRGVTPLTLTELQPGTWKFNIQLYNYEPATVTLAIAGNQTNAFHINLVSQSYTGAMRAARQFMNDGKYDQAAESLADALRVQPGDPAATALQKEAAGFGSIARAETLGKQGDLIVGIKELEKALAALPNNERAKQMLADFKQHESEQIERVRVERLNQGKKAFDAVIASKYPGGNLFETHELKTSKTPKDIELPLLHALKSEPGKFTVTQYNESPELFEIEAKQEFSTVLATSAGRRQCVIVGARTKDDETQILFKVLEYKVEAKGKLSIGNWIGAPADVNYVPIRAAGESEKLQVRVAEGISNVTAIIQGVIAQVPVESR